MPCTTSTLSSRNLARPGSRALCHDDSSTIGSTSEKSSLRAHSATSAARAAAPDHSVASWTAKPSPLNTRKSGIRRKRVYRALFAALAFCITAPGVAQTTAPPLPLPEYGATPDITGAENRPDGSLDYRVVFDITQTSQLTEENAGLVRVARFVNTLAQHGVPPDKRHIAVVIHGPATKSVMTDAAFAQRTGASNNPSTTLIRALKKAGVDLHVCGQAARGMHINTDMIMPEVTADLSATFSLIHYQMRDYVLVSD